MLAISTRMMYPYTRDSQELGKDEDRARESSGDDAARARPRSDRIRKPDVVTLFLTEGRDQRPSSC